MEPKTVSDIDLSQLPVGCTAKTNGGHEWKLKRIVKPSSTQSFAAMVLHWSRPKGRVVMFMTDEKGQRLFYAAGEWKKLDATHPNSIDTSSIKLPKMKVSDVDFTTLPIGTRVGRCPDPNPTAPWDWAEITTHDSLGIWVRPFKSNGEPLANPDGSPRIVRKPKRGFRGDRRGGGSLYYETAILPKLDPRGATTETVEVPVKTEAKRPEDMSLSEWLEQEAWV